MRARGWTAVRLLAVGLCAAACSRPNPVAEYFEGAQIKATRAEIDSTLRQALSDITFAAAPDLRMFRYADASGKPTLDLRVVLKRHLVPSGPKPLPEDDSLYDLLATDRVRRLAQGFLGQLGPDTPR